MCVMCVYECVCVRACLVAHVAPSDWCLLCVDRSLLCVSMALLSGCRSLLRFHRSLAHVALSPCHPP